MDNNVKFLIRSLEEISSIPGMEYIVSLFIAKEPRITEYWEVIVIYKELTDEIQKSLNLMNGTYEDSYLYLIPYKGDA